MISDIEILIYRIKQFTAKALMKMATNDTMSRQVEELMHYHDLHQMRQIRGRIDCYLIALMIQAYYRTPERYNALDADGREILSYLDSECFYQDRLAERVYPIPLFMRSPRHDTSDALFAYIGHLSTDTGEIHSDSSGACYTDFHGRKIFIGMNNKAVAHYWTGLLREQDPRHPHCYCDENAGFSVQQGDIVADVGAAEGIFTLMHIDKIKHAYLFEASDYWFPLLQKTFDPYKEKITLVKGFVGDSDGQIKLDDFFKDKEKPNFIKMDVEGAEPLVLRGMNGMLRDKSLSMKLAVCTYHRQEDGPWIEKFLGNDFENITYSKSYYWHMQDPMPPFLRRGVLRAVRNCPPPPRVRPLGCMDQLGREVVIGHKVQLCCHQHPKDPGYFGIDYADVKQGIEECLRRTLQLKEQHKLGIAGPCEGCYRLTDDPEKFTKTGDSLGVLINSGGFKGDVCNVKCCYCNFTDTYSDRTFDIDLPDIVHQLTEVYSGKKLLINFANGEFFARKDADAILRHLLPKNVVVSLTTNGSLWNNVYEEIIKAKKAGAINVSLDCGTRETYKKVKNRDFFDIVVKNLERYSAYGLSVDMKYIILPGINDNEADFQGFIDAAKRIRPRLFRIAADNNTRSVPLSDYSRGQTALFYKLASEQGFHPQLCLDYFNKDDAAYFRELLIA